MALYYGFRIIYSFSLNPLFATKFIKNAGELNAGEAVFSFFSSRAFWSYFFFISIHSPSKVMVILRQSALFTTLLTYINYAW